MAFNLPTRTGHGDSVGKPHIEVVAKDLPVGVAAPQDPIKRRRNGTFADPESAKAAGRKGGLAKHAKSPDRWAKHLGLGRMIERFPVDGEIAPFANESEQWFKQTCAEIARDVGGGQLSPGCCSIVRTAAWERAFSTFLFDLATRGQMAWDVRDPLPLPNAKHRLTPRTDLVLVAARLGDSSRQNILAAHELAAREAQSRTKTSALDPKQLQAVGWGTDEKA